MAYIDKIYGTREQWNELHAFLSQTKPDWIKKYMYSEPEVEGPLSNFSYGCDQWLLKNCPLEFVIDRIKEQYNLKKG